jgi:hypothetical protein
LRAGGDGSGFAPMPTAVRPTIKAIREKLGEAHAVTSTWRRAGLCTSREWVYAWIGVADPDGVKIAAEEFEASFGRDFPEDLRLLWSELNGIAIHARSGVPDAPACVLVEPRELPDPIIWPARGRGDPLQIADGDLHPTANLYLFGELKGHGFLAIAVPDDQDDQAEDVVWVDKSLRRRPAKISPSLRDFLSRWCGNGFLLTGLLAEAGVQLQGKARK